MKLVLGGCAHALQQACRGARARGAGRGEDKHEAAVTA